MLSKFKALLRESGHSLTAGRLQVFTYLHEHGPTSIINLMDAVESNIDRSSLYRTLNLFRKLNIIQDIVTGGRNLIELSDRLDHHHHHITCSSCGATQVFTDPAIEQHLNRLAQAHGLKSLSHQIEVNGLCSKCQKLLI